MNINFNFGWQPRPNNCCFYPRPQLRPVNSHHGNLDGAVVGRTRGGFFRRSRPVRGYGIDLNQNGRYDRGQDGVLAFDFNRDGKLNKKEIGKSQKMLRAFSGNNDLNGDGRVTRTEKRQAGRYRARMQKMDRNRDGRLSAHELSAAGGKVGVDHNRDGNFGRHETYSPHSIPTPGFGRGRLDFVDPARNHTQVNHGWAWSHPPHHCRYC